MAAAIALIAANCVADSFVVDVPADVDRNIADAVDLEALVKSTGDLVKTGGGRLIIDRSLKGYKGEIRVEEGYLLAVHNEAFGDIDKGTVVSSGATLEFKHDTEALLFGKEQFTVSGNGVDGCGVLYHTGTVKDQWRAVFEKVKLAGNSRFGGIYASDKYRRWDIRGAQGTFDMQGYDLEVTCVFGLASVDVVNPGNITVIGNKSQLCVEGKNVKMNGSSQNTITLLEKTALSSQSFGPALKWGVVLDGGTLLEQNSNQDYENVGRIDGPLTITEKGGKFQTFNAGGHWSLGGSFDIKGEVSAGGSVVIDLMVLCGADNIEQRMRDYQTLRSKVASSVLDSQMRIMLYTANGSDGKPPIYSRDMVDESITLDLAGTAAMEMSGSQSAVAYRQLGGYVKMTGSEKVHTFKDMVVSGDATLDIVGAGTIDIHTNALSVGGKYPALPKVRVEDTLLTTNWTDRAKNGSNNIHIGPVRKISSDAFEVSSYFGGRGIMEVCDGAVISNIFNIGFVSSQQNQRNSFCHGSLFVRGGEVAMTGAGGEYVYNRIGSGGSGYIEVSGGTVKALDYIYPASGQNGRGVWYQKGGTTHIGSKAPGFVWGQFSRTENPSKGVYWQTDGLLQCEKPLVFGKTLYDTSNCGNQDQFTISGGDVFVNHGVDLAGAPDAKTIFNLNGGTFKAMFVQVLTNENQTSIGTGSDKQLDGTHAWINMNGGTYSYLHRTDRLTGYAAYNAMSFFYGDPERMRLTAYAGGAILDTAGHDRNLDHTITAPSGKGLVSLALPEDVAVTDWMFAGSPYIEIEGDGSGASAVAEFDSVNGRITGFTVTSPGNDYTEISAKLTHGGYTNEIPLVCTLGKVVSGGLIKKGEGVLRMNAANTYEGVTRVEGGTLKAVYAEAIPANNGIEIAGGTLDAGGFEKAYGAIAATSGTLQNAAGTFASFEKTGDGVFMFNAPLSGTKPLEVKEGVLKLPVSVPGLLCGEKVYQSGAGSEEYDKAMPLSGLGIELTPSRAYKLTGEGYYQPRHYVSYSGYAWNRSATNETWTFAYSFDDSLKVYVNGEVLTATKCGGDGWGALSLAKATLKPGANSILIQLWNGPDTGGAISHGLVRGCVNWTKDHVGIVYNPNGGDSTNGLDYVRMTDPGDGSLFTVYPYDSSTLPDISAVKMWPGTTLDVCGGNYVFTGRLQVTEEVFANPIRVLGGISFGAGATVDVGGIENLDREVGVRTVLVTDSGVSGVLPKLEGAWRLRVSSDGKNLELLPRRGTAIVLR